jgi:cytochrome P450
LVRNPLSALTEKTYEEPYVIQNYGFGRLVFVTDPALIKTVLLDATDVFVRSPQEAMVLGPLMGRSVLLADRAEWRWQRQAAAPLFRHSDLLSLTPVMEKSARTTLDSWLSLVPGAVHDVYPDLSKTAFRVLDQTLLASSETAAGSVVEHAWEQYLEPVTWAMANAMMMLPSWVPHPGRRQMRRAAATLRAAVAQIVQERRRVPAGQQDLLGRLMSAKDPETGQQMDDELLSDNIITFMVAGHETTALAVTWSLYLLALHPAWQDRLAEETTRVLEGGPVTAGNLDRLEVTRQVLKEAMRLYPPALEILRVVATETTLAGERLSPGTVIVVSMYAAHRHRKRWIEPNFFDPTRFEPAREHGYPRYQFMPFGAGPRTCIGAAFALIEATTFLATLVGAIRFEAPPDLAPVPLAQVTLRPKGGMPLRMVPRA